MKRMPRLLTILAIWLATLPLPLALADGSSTAKKLFQEAFFQQTVEGDIAHAIKLYQQGLEEPDIPAKLAATAYDQLSICYEKQGARLQAISCYTAIIYQYPGEEKKVAKAKERAEELRLLHLRPDKAQPQASRIPIGALADGRVG